MRIVIAAAVLFALSAASHAQDAAAKTKVAQMAFLAQLAPKVCPGYEMSIVAVAAFMAAAQINERQLLEDYSTATSEAGNALEASVKRDPDAACDQIWRQLGTEGLGLITGED